MQFLWNEGLRGRDTKFDRKLRSTLGIRRSPWEHLETMNLLLKFWKVYIYIYILLDLWKGVRLSIKPSLMPDYRERERGYASFISLYLDASPGPPFRTTLFERSNYVAWPREMLLLCYAPTSKSGLPLEGWYRVMRPWWGIFFFARSR